MRKVTQYAERHDAERRAAAQTVHAYTLWHKHHNPEHALDPTDHEGNLLREFSSYIACYINELSPGYSPKAAFVNNQPRQRCEVWLAQAVEQDEEIFLYYGQNYLRDYPIDSQSCGNRPSYYIAAGSLLTLDRRGSPTPLQLPA